MPPGRPDLAELMFAVRELSKDVANLKADNEKLINERFQTLQRQAEKNENLIRINEETLQHLPAELSGGEQQRVAIARALVNDPAIVFADEPTGNLDSKSGEAIMNLLLSLARERKKTLLVVTHDPHLATLGDRQLHMTDGLLTES